ncbi:MAG: carboxylesterase family protein [Archangiaceae bacterium]|nr:carboxylesterase family protein [Archangiaceae bacterium]
MITPLEKLALLLLAPACAGLPTLPAPVPDGGAPAPPGQLQVAQGAVRGTQVGSTWVYLGIPYAAPPVGALRFSPPAPPARFDAPHPATAFGPDCPQRSTDGGFEGDEDCLTLNVWAPAERSAAPAPVLVFIHGGAHITGGASRPAYDGRALSEHGGVVVVSLNYRLGVLGFLAHPALGASTGNWGYRDQTAALQWVHHNIGAFGGDPARVLLFGQSAGATSTCVQLAAPSARGLFSSAMMLSGGCGAQPKAAAERRGESVARLLGCDGAADVAACLRGKSVDELLAVGVNDGQATTATAGPTLDGTYLVEDPQTAVTHAGVPVIVSSTADEFTNQLGRYGGTRAVSSAADYQALLRQLYPATADALLARYPASDYPSANDALVALEGDRYFICPSRAAARALSRSGQPVWRVHFSHTFAAGPLRPYRAAHGFDLLFGFRNLGAYPLSPDERRLSDAVADAWVRFAGQGAVDWPRYDPARDDYLVLDQPLATGEGLRTPFCDFWGP